MEVNTRNVCYFNPFQKSTSNNTEDQNVKNSRRGVSIYNMREDHAGGPTFELLCPV
jgi:hypothetical protein